MVSDAFLASKCSKFVVGLNSELFVFRFFLANLNMGSELDLELKMGLVPEDKKQDFDFNTEIRCLKKGGYPYDLQHPDRSITCKYVKHDGCDFFTMRMSVLPGVKLKGKIIILHGWSENLFQYLNIMESLTSYGYECFIYDQRGYGKTSPGKQRGQVGDENMVYTDLDRMIEIAFKFEQEEPKLTYSILSHSMGGTLALLYCQKGRYRNRIDNLIASNPLVDLPSPMVFIFSIILTIFSLVSTNIRIAPSSCKTGVTNYEPWLKYLENQEKDHNIGTVGLFKYLIARSKQLRRLSKVQELEFHSGLKVLFLLTSKDTIVSPGATVQLFENLKTSDKKLIEFDNCGHGLFMENETIYNNVCNAIKKFIDQ